MDKDFLQDIKEKLEKKKEITEKELQSFANKDEKLKGDWDTRFPKFNGGNLEEAANEVEEYESRLPIEHSSELRLRDVNSALEKIRTSLSARTLNASHILEKGNYGKCEKCGKDIPEERLKVYPEARFCLKCGQ